MKGINKAVVLSEESSLDFLAFEISEGAFNVIEGALVGEVILDAGYNVFVFEEVWVDYHLRLGLSRLSGPRSGETPD
jgi:hypothetical protein